MKYINMLQRLLCWRTRLFLPYLSEADGPICQDVRYWRRQPGERRAATQPVLTVLFCSPLLPLLDWSLTRSFVRRAQTSTTTTTSAAAVGWMEMENRPCKGVEGVITLQAAAAAVDPSLRLAP